VLTAAALGKLGCERRRVIYTWLAMAPLRRLHIVVLDCDTPVLDVYAEKGTYGDIYEALLRDAVTHPGVPKLELEFSGYDCVKGCLPSMEDLERVHRIIMTGSGISPRFEL
jgi:hypothetical protein